MRFFENGPNIPDKLLEQRDKGRVVFLCGAGVSVGVGLPNFQELTGRVVAFFDPAETSLLSETYEFKEGGEFESKVPLDQIFQLLYQEFGREEVQGVVARVLDKSPDNECAEHQIVARLSADQEGRSQIVTTNFDRLFEQVPALDGCLCHTPPAFPDIDLGIPMHGVTYLHGRLQSQDKGVHSYVLSSSDFGRAYLSEAWATNFMRSLLDHYTVVLVGYQAEDPPIKYLLQGLNHDGSVDRSRLYAFDKGPLEEVSLKWFDRGVTAIPFDDFPDLWKSLEAWAERADDPRVWRARVVEMAKGGPRSLADFQRGQVAHLLRNAAGARLFANADPSPPAEWLCVFDRRYRFTDSREKCDLVQSYGLDDDIHVASEHVPEKSEIGGILEWRSGDFASQSVFSLAQQRHAIRTELPPRLLNLCGWIADNANSPIVLWWAVRQQKLHPRLLEELQQRVAAKNFHPEARRLWELFFRYILDERALGWSWGRGCFDLKDKIRRDGWSLSSLRLFEDVVTPILTCDTPFSVVSPPLNDWSETDASSVAKWDVKFPEWHGEVLEIPDDHVGDVFEILEGSMRLAENLLSETGAVVFTEPTCYPNREVEGELREDDSTFYWFLELFDRLIKLRPGSAIARAAIWSTERDYYFKRLKMYSLNQASLFTAGESLCIFRGFVFSGQVWDHDIRREVLFYLNDRWEEFSLDERSEIIELMVKGPCADRGEGQCEAAEHDDHIGLYYIQWLRSQDKALSEKDSLAFQSAVEAIPDWNEGVAEHLTKYNGLLVGSIKVDENTEVLENLPISLIASNAEEAQKTDLFSCSDHRPFDGLVKRSPRKAFLSLSYAAKRGSYSKLLWAALLNNLPESAPQRLITALLERLARLPDSFVVEIRSSVSRWLSAWFKQAFFERSERAWRAFDNLLPGLVDERERKPQSEISNAGEAGSESFTYGHAINHPAGIMAQTLLRVVFSIEPSDTASLGEDFTIRLGRLLDASGRSGESTASILAGHISQLYIIAPAWVVDHLLPRFEFEHPHCSPVWNGFLSAALVPPRPLMEKLKPAFLELFEQIENWGWESDVGRIAAQMTVLLSLPKDSEPLLSTKDARWCIRSMTNRNRKDAVDYLGKVGTQSEEAWTEEVIPFIENIWPREIALKTASLTESWVHLIEKTGDKYLLVLQAVRRFLTPVRHENNWLHSFSRSARSAWLTAEYPEGVLELLSVLISYEESSPDFS